MSLSRDDWKKRLKDAELDEDIVETFVDGLSDDDLVRMKEASLEQIKGAVVDALTKCFSGDQTRKEDDEDDDDDEKDQEDMAKKKDATGLKDLMEFADYIVAQTEERVVAKIKDMLESQEIEVEVPLLDEMKDSLTEMGTQFKELLATDAERLKDTYEDMSTASKARLSRHFSTDAMETIERAVQHNKEKAAHLKGGEQPVVDNGGAIIKDANGKTFESMADFVAG